VTPAGADESPIIQVRGLINRFGEQTVHEALDLDVRRGEILGVVGGSGTGKSVLMRSILGLRIPNEGQISVLGADARSDDMQARQHIERNTGVLFQDGALFSSLTVGENVQVPLKEHHPELPDSWRYELALLKVKLAGLPADAIGKLPSQLSGGMRKRAGLARALVLDPEIVLFDEPDSGLDPVRTAFLNQLIVDLNAQIDATFLIVTHDINTARTVPDNIGLLYHRHLAMFGPREQLLSSEEPVVRQFLNAQRVGPIGMSEEKDADELEAEKDQELPPLPPIPLQQEPSNGIPRRSQRPPGEWCRLNGVTPPPGSFATTQAGLAPGT